MSGSSSSDDSSDSSDSGKKESSEVKIVKPSLIDKSKLEISLGDVLLIQMTRKEIAEHLNQPYLKELIKDCFVRVVYSQSEYRMCKVEGLAYS